MLIRIIYLFCLLLILTACGGGGGDGDGGPQLSSGVFIDSPVEGLRYQTATQDGFTDTNGIFTYLSGEEISFYIGGILLGSAAGEALITPIDLVPGAVDHTDPRVINILRFVQSLDDDNDPSNGIRITAEVSDLAANMSIDFNQSIIDFENDGNVQTVVAELTAVTSAGARSLIDAETAQTHLLDSLNNTGNAGEVGTLTISGNDQGVIGTSFAPGIMETQSIPEFSVIVGTWASTGVENFNQVIVSITGTQIGAVEFRHMPSIIGTDIYFYVCSAFQCPGVSANLAAKTVTFNNAQIQIGAIQNVINNNLATGPIVLNGTLAWE